MIEFKNFSLNPYWYPAPTFFFVLHCSKKFHANNIEGEIQLEEIQKLRQGVRANFNESCSNVSWKKKQTATNLLWRKINKKKPSKINKKNKFFYLFWKTRGYFPKSSENNLSKRCVESE